MNKRDEEAQRRIAYKEQERLAQELSPKPTKRFSPDFLVAAFCIGLVVAAAVLLLLV